MNETELKKRGYQRPEIEIMAVEMLAIMAASDPDVNFEGGTEDNWNTNPSVEDADPVDGGDL